MGMYRNDRGKIEVERVNFLMQKEPEDPWWVNISISQEEENAFRGAGEGVIVFGKIYSPPVFIGAPFQTRLSLITEE
jgi:hypothetical protein